MNTISPGTEKLLSLKYLKGLGDKSIASLSSLKNIDNLDIEYIAEHVLNKKGVYSSDDISLARSRAFEQIEIANNLGHKIISFLDDDYSENLRAANNAAPIIFCAGDATNLNKKNITIIGTREPTQHGRIIAQKVTEWFTSNAWCVVSGLAIGIDTIGHKTALEKGGGTIAVLAHGLEKIYPATNKILADEILANNGLLISEYPYNSFVGKSNFVQRDTVQAALSSAVVLIQTGIKGGSLHASRAALKFNRPLIVVGQSKTDLSNNESKIQGNISLINGSFDIRRNILNMDSFDNNLIIALHNKHHFSTIERYLEHTNIEHHNKYINTHTIEFDF